MFLDSGEKTKGEVHWIISYDKDEDIHYVECPVTPMEFGEGGEVVSGKTWHLTTLTKGSFSHCAEWIYSLARFEQDGWDESDFIEVERPGGNETRQEDEASG